MALRGVTGVLEITDEQGPGKEKLSPVAIANIKAAWDATHGGGRSGGTAIVVNGTWKPVVLTSVDSQFHEMRAFAVAEIARVFRVPPVLLQDYGRATWSNSSEMGRQFLTYCLTPWLKRIEAEARIKLLQPGEHDSHVVEVLVDDLLRADTAARATAYAQFRSAGILTANEIRAMENRPPIAGGDVLQNPYTATATPTGSADA